MDDVKYEHRGDHWELELAAARLAEHGRGIGRVTVVLGYRPSYDEVFELRRQLNEEGADVAMSVHGDGALTFRRVDTSKASEPSTRSAQLAGGATG